MTRRRDRPQTHTVPQAPGLLPSLLRGTSPGATSKKVAAVSHEYYMGIVFVLSENPGKVTTCGLARPSISWSSGSENLGLGGCCERVTSETLQPLCRRHWASCGEVMQARAYFIQLYPRVCGWVASSDIWGTRENLYTSFLWGVEKMTLPHCERRSRTGFGLQIRRMWCCAAVREKRVCRIWSTAWGQKREWPRTSCLEHDFLRIPRSGTCPSRARNSA